MNRTPTPAAPTALLADDEPHLARALQQALLELWPELRVVATVRNGLEAAARIESLQPDVAFLDIKMPGMTGLEVARQVTAPTRLVFVTAFDAFAVAAFDHAAVDYVLKPVRAQRLAQTVARLKAALAVSARPSDDEDARLLSALQRLAGGAQGQPMAPRLHFIRAAIGEVTHHIDVQEVIAFLADEKYTCVRTARSEYLIRTPLAELAEQLDPALFAQVHRSSIVNLRHVEATRRDEASRLFLRMKGLPRELPVSRAYVHLFKAM